MFKKLLDLIKQAFSISDNQTVETAILEQLQDYNLDCISDEMKGAIQTWLDMYQDNSPWLSETMGVSSMGLGKFIPEELAKQVMSEMEMSITEPNAPIDDDIDTSQDEAPTNMAEFLNDQFTKHLYTALKQYVEKGMATGGLIIKPYVSGEDIYFSFNIQGEFIPLGFDNDGMISDVAFLDRFIDKGLQYTRVERQKFIQSQQRVIIENKAFVAKKNMVSGEYEELGKQLELTEVSQWADIAPEVTIDNVQRPLFGYYKVPTANHIDLNSPLGSSVFASAVKMIEKCDQQFSRLDWEYEGGQLAVDVDPTALKQMKQQTRMARLKERLYRGVDVGTDDTYNEFAPTLRDGSYISGLDKYLTKVEDLCGLARGTIAEVQSDARTATELNILKQRTYTTINDNQQALERALKDVVYSMYVLTTLYGLSADGDYTLNIDWSDSILTDTETELQQKVLLKNEGILSDVEVRAWYTGETMEVAQARIEEIKQKQLDEQEKLDDIFTMTGGSVTIQEEQSQEDKEKEKINDESNTNE